MRSKESMSRQAQYDKENTKGLYLKLNVKTDADVLEWLEHQSNKQGEVKNLIRWAIAVERVREACENVQKDNTFCSPEDASVAAAENEALAIVWAWHGVKFPAGCAELSAEERSQMRIEQKLLLLASIGLEG